MKGGPERTRLGTDPGGFGTWSSAKWSFLGVYAKKTWDDPQIIEMGVFSRRICRLGGDWVISRMYGCGGWDAQSHSGCRSLELLFYTIAFKLAGKSCQRFQSTRFEIMIPIYPYTPSVSGDFPDTGAGTFHDIVSPFCWNPMNIPLNAH